MTASPDQLEALRTQITTAIKHGTDVIADLKAVADRFQILMPDDRQHTKGERWADVARLCGLDASMPEHLETLVECLADVLAGLTTSDGGERWLQHQRARLAAGEDAAA